MSGAARERVAIVGTGISGLVVAHRLADTHDLTVFEAGEHVGGHTHTHDFEVDGVTHAVDSGFIVFNERTYPNFLALLQELGVPWRASDMSFSVRDDRDGLEYNGTNPSGLFAQRRNLLRPRFWGMLRDTLRFYRGAHRYLEPEFATVTLGEVLRQEGFGRSFVEQHILPMGAAVWSSTTEGMLDFPIQTFARFFHNHGFLQLRDRPQWLTVIGGSRAYIDPITAPFADRIRTRTPIRRVRRRPEGGVEVETHAGELSTFDRVVLACHSDQALALLESPTAEEREILGAIPYQPNDVTIHTDTSILPRARRAWSSWNVRIDPGDGPESRLRATYWMNRLQGLEAPVDFLVTLNDADGIDPSRVLRRLQYSHPLFTPEGIAAQGRHGEIDGVGGVHFCGAYWGYGFHEDGVKSALAVLARIPGGRDGSTAAPAIEVETRERSEEAA